MRRAAMLMLVILACGPLAGACAAAHPRRGPHAHAAVRHLAHKPRHRRRAARKPAGRRPTVHRRKPASQRGTAPSPAATARPAGAAPTTATTLAPAPRPALSPVASLTGSPSIPGLPPAPSSSPAGSIASAAPAGGSPDRPFAATSFWNAPLPAGAPFDPASSVYVAELQRQVARYQPWINTTKYSSPVYTVPAGQPDVHVTLDKLDPALQAVFDHVPIPPGARPAAGTDGTMVVWQPATDTMWEFWQASLRSDGWHASWGGRMSGVSTNPGYYTDHPRWGATATSLPMLGGLMRIDELKAGTIDHALAIAIPDVRATVYSWPAQRTDGNDASPDAIPEGTRFRLDPTLDLSKLPMAPIVREMAEAVQRYGMVVRDRAGAVAFYGEDPTPTGSDPYGQIFGGRAPSALLAQFPWAHLQALRTQLRVDPI